MYIVMCLKNELSTNEQIKDMDFKNMLTLVLGPLHMWVTVVNWSICGTPSSGIRA